VAAWKRAKSKVKGGRSITGIRGGGGRIHKKINACGQRLAGKRTVKKGERRGRRGWEGERTYKKKSRRHERSVSP